MCRADRFPGRDTDLARVVENLATNAARYARTTVSVLGPAAPRQRVEFTVTDDGPGIAQADRARIFERFSTLDESRSPRPKRGRSRPLDRVGDRRGPRGIDLRRGCARHRCGLRRTTSRPLTWFASLVASLAPFRGRGACRSERASGTSGLPVEEELEHQRAGVDVGGGVPELLFELRYRLAGPRVAAAVHDVEHGGGLAPLPGPLAHLV